MRLLIADDHPIVISGIEAVLRDTLYEVIGSARTGAEALAMIPELKPDIVILDVQMPEGTGLDVLKTLRGRGDGRPVILLTASLSDERLLEAIELGVQGIVLKEGAEHLLSRCLDEVARGRRWIDHGLLQKALDLKMKGGDRTADGIGALSPRERAIAALVARGRRNREIGEELNLTEGTVKVYLHKMYEKLGVSNRTELALIARDSTGK